MKASFLIVALLILSVLICLSCKDRKWNNPFDPDNELPYLPQLTFFPAAGSYTEGQSVSITCSIAGAEIRFTTDGSIPTQTSNLYESPLEVNASFSINAMAFKVGYNPSPLTSASYQISNMVASPIFDPPGGIFNSGQSVSISCATPDAIIRYTTNGTDPGTSSAAYINPLSFNADTELRARAYKEGMNPSSVCSALYNINLSQVIPTPVFDPPAGSYPSTQSVSITCTLSGADIRYTLDGSTPSQSSQLYTGPLQISSTSTLKAIAIKTGWIPSSVGSALYTIAPQCATPTFNPPGGVYSIEQAVSINCSTPEAEIRYTINGSTPTTSSTLYTEPLAISSTLTLKAKAFKTGLSPSNLAITSYSFSYPTLPVPEASPNGGIFLYPESVTLSCSIDGATIRYTTNGLDPNSSSAVYTEQVYIPKNTILKARAYKSGHNASQMLTVHYFIRTYLQAWGRNDVGQCDIPVYQDIIDMAAGSYHGLAIRSDKSLLAWGYNGEGQTNVPSGTDYIRVAAGYYHSLALRQNGSLVAWGRNNEGQCNVPSGTDFVAISAGNNYCLAIRRDGQIIAWGSNDAGCLNVPTGSFTKVSAGFNHCLAIRSDGSLQAWGRNNEGQCEVPAGTDFVDIAAGYQHCLALRQSGSLVAWGDNYTQQCDVPPGFFYISVGAGYGHSTAIRTDGSLAAWGRNEYQQCEVPSGDNYHYVASGFFNNIAQRTLIDMKKY
ncbi:MAG: chitobiase/beta-hexosaminidase C-terminal domain-containing protein [Candidatus Cloacimonetes bacterium]|nr:chitobiase/beta-hexosaminidase C-terminal domain-containing protein [Candidatus Cloacimonadota bacterium]